METTIKRPYCRIRWITWIAVVALVVSLTLQFKPIRNYQPVSVDFASGSLLLLSNDAIQENDPWPSCSKWAVVSLTRSISNTIQRISNSADWCVVVVTTRERTITPNVTSNIHWFTAKEHAECKHQQGNTMGELCRRSLSLDTPANHRNLGYLYAIHKGAKMILDLDEAIELPAHTSAFAPLQLLEDSHTPKFNSGIWGSLGRSKPVQPV